MADAALSDLTVLDLTHEIAGPYCTKLLADYGATVLKVEPPGGEGGRRRGPFPRFRPAPETGAPFLHLNTNKLGITLNLKATAGRRLFLALVERVDLVVENFRPGALAALGLGYAALRARNPRVVLVSIANFGQTGPHAPYTASELTAFASTGVQYHHGELEREPLKFGGNQAQYFGGAAGAAAALTALRAAARDGEGEHVDVSIQEAAMPLAELEIHRQAYSGDQPLEIVPRRPYYRQLGSFPSGIYHCRDGYILAFGGSGPRNLARIARMLDMPELATDPRFTTTEAMNAHKDEFEAILAGWFLDHDRVEIRDRAQAARLTWSIPHTIDELFTDPQFVHRRFFVRVRHPCAGEQTYPGAPFRMPLTPWRITRPAPLRGEHNALVYRGWLGLSRQELARLGEAGVI